MLFVQRRALSTVRVFTGRVLLHLAKEAVTAGNHKRDHHPITFLHVFHFAPALHHLAHKFMTKDIAVLDLGNFSAIKMQIRTTDRRGGYAQDDIVRLFDTRIGDIIDPNMMWTVIGESFHATSERVWVSL